TLIKDLHAALFQLDLTVYIPYFVLICAATFKHPNNIVMSALKTSEYVHAVWFIFLCSFIFFHAYLHIIIPDLL
ncbi:MAG: hypothetical protein K2J47_11335, partial [Ruminococcus sp.]|nr:hypothetical protein [Ruminococcus sp.]